MSKIKAYLAGPDVFFSGAVAHATRKLQICATYGIIGRSPLNEDAAPIITGGEHMWRTIYQKNIAMMEECDIIIANLTPFGGASADAGTLIEVGYFRGRGRSIFGYSNTVTLFTERSQKQLAVDGILARGVSVEGFGLPDNLMIPGAVESGGYSIFLPTDGQNHALEDLQVFEVCVKAVAQKLKIPAQS